LKVKALIKQKRVIHMSVEPSLSCSGGELWRVNPPEELDASAVPGVDGSTPVGPVAGPLRASGIKDETQKCQCRTRVARPRLRRAAYPQK
jgi:hypothetical protein